MLPEQYTRRCDKIAFDNFVAAICRLVCLGLYSPEPRAEVYCLQLNFKISKLAYYPDRAPVAQLVSVGLRTNTHGVKITDEKVLPLKLHPQMVRLSSLLGYGP